MQRPYKTNSSETLWSVASVNVQQNHQYPRGTVIGTREKIIVTNVTFERARITHFPTYYGYFTYIMTEHDESFCMKSGSVCLQIFVPGLGVIAPWYS